MKKVKLIGALLAAVIAAAPATGLTGNILSVNNIIEAAVSIHPNGPDEFWPGDRFPSHGNSTYTVNFEGSNIFFASTGHNDYIRQSKNGTKRLYLYDNGTLVVKIRTGYRNNYQWKDYKTLFKPKGKYSRCMLAMQWDGNFVIYANHDYRMAINHWGAQPNLAYNGNKYTFTLNDSGEINIAYNGIVCKTIK